VIGIWQLSDQSGNPAPASTPSAFNSTTWGMSRLDAQFTLSDTFRVGVADYRGDGRPDYFYRASLLYSDTVTPARSVCWRRDHADRHRFQSEIAGDRCEQSRHHAFSVGEPDRGGTACGVQDGTASIQVTDSVSGAFSQMIGALTYGALSTDLLLLLQGGGAGQLQLVRSRQCDPRARRGRRWNYSCKRATLTWSATNGCSSQRAAELLRAQY